MIVDHLRLIGSTQTNVIMAAELSRVAKRVLDVRPPEPKKEGLGQLVYPFDPALARAAVTYLRTPTRVVWDVFRSTAGRLEPLYDELLEDVANDPRTYFRDGDGISVEARRTEAFPAGERQIVGTVKNALIDGAHRRGIRLHVDPDRPASRWIARLDDKNELIVSIDLGGGSLSQRGWRREAGDAPIREHLAAVLVMLTRFDPRRDALVDPMCGSGTIPIEAVLAARTVPRDTFGLDGIPAFGGKQAPAPALYPDAAPLVIGCDREVEMLAIARDNARHAGIADAITWQRKDIATLEPSVIADIAREKGREPPTQGVLLANPPYGERLAEYELSALYAATAHTCRKFRGWRAAFIVGTPLFEEVVNPIFGGRPHIKKPLANANLRAYFLLYSL